MALDCLTHELDFCADICMRYVGGLVHYLRVTESKLPLVNLVCLNLAAGSKEEHSPFCSHSTVLGPKKDQHHHQHRILKGRYCRKVYHGHSINQTFSLGAKLYGCRSILSMIDAQIY